MEHIKGKKMGEVFLYTLSTCIWCKKTKALLKELGVDFTYEDVDLLEGEESEKTENEMEKYTDNPSFPLIIINGKFFHSGFDEAIMRKRFGK
ncbi:MAG: glutaredoxin family protein [Candidatus Goldiibacteriota bacterium]|jgi:glutaredoxin